MSQPQWSRGGSPWPQQFPTQPRPGMWAPPGVQQQPGPYGPSQAAWPGQAGQQPWGYPQAGGFGQPYPPRQVPQHHRMPYAPPGLAPYPPQYRQAPGRPTPPRRRGLRWWVVALPLVVVALMAGYRVLTAGDGGTDVANPEVSSSTVAVDYVNDDYIVPGVGQGPAEVFDPWDQPELLAENPLFGQPVAVPVQCRATPLSDVRSARALERRMDQLTECLTRVHGPALLAAGFEPYRPRALTYSGEGESPCGRLYEGGAFFCPANQAIYMSTRISRVVGTEPMAIDYVIAHEYSHNVQGRNGALLQIYYERSRVQGEEQEAQLERRIETQADCFAGAFLHSVSQSLGYGDEDRALAVESAGGVGDDQFEGDGSPGTHGVAASRMLWMERGLNARSYADCNTFVAPASEVR